MLKRRARVIAVLMTCAFVAAMAPASATSTTWVATPIASPTGFEGLSSVSCPTTTDCFAVGNASVSRGIDSSAFAERWDGSTWTPLSGVAPSVGNSNQLNSISCVSLRFCAAVGASYVGRVPDGLVSTLIMTWNGSKWSAQTTTFPPGGLTSVSCTTATSCVAVGRDIAGAAFIEWDGVSWTHRPESPAGASGLSDVSCASAMTCVAIGAVGWQPISVLLTPTGYTVSDLEVPANTLVFPKSISCSAVNDCVAVGYRNASNGGIPAAPWESLVEHWDGAVWTIVPSPSPPNSAVTLHGVHCLAPTDCIAAGDNPALLAGSTFIERWDGTSWVIEPSADVPAPTNDWLNAVTCMTTRCVAVGGYQNKALPGIQSQALALTRPNTVVRKTVAVSWSASDAARLQQVAAYLGVAPDIAQKTAVFVVGYLIGFAPPTQLPQNLPTVGTAVEVETDWAGGEIAVLESVTKKFDLNDSDAIRFSTLLVSYLLALGGH